MLNRTNHVEIPAHPGEGRPVVGPPQASALAAAPNLASREFARFVTFSMEVSGEVGSLILKKAGKLQGPQDRRLCLAARRAPATIDFDKCPGILALAVTAIPTSTTRRSFDEDSDGNPANDGVPTGIRTGWCWARRRPARAD